MRAQKWGKKWGKSRFFERKKSKGISTKLSESLDNWRREEDLNLRIRSRITRFPKAKKRAKRPFLRVFIVFLPVFASFS